MANSVGKTLTGVAFVLAGAGLAVSGIVLLLRAGWIAIALALGPVWASTILGGALLLVGGLMIWLTVLHIGRRSAPSDADLVVQITKAFLEGIVAGRSVRR